MPPGLSRPLPQHQLKTVFLRVPGYWWPLVSSGKVSEFRSAVGNAPQLWHLPLPTFAVLYRKEPSRRTASYRIGDRRPSIVDYRLMLLEAIRREALGAITDEGLAAAGYEGRDAMARFRREWMIAERRRFEPLRTVFVYTVRAATAEDAAPVGERLVKHLFGDFLDTARERTRTVRVDDVR